MSLFTCTHGTCARTSYAVHRAYSSATLHSTGEARLQVMQYRHQPTDSPASTLQVSGIPAHMPAHSLHAAEPAAPGDESGVSPEEAARLALHAGHTPLPSRSSTPEHPLPAAASTAATAAPARAAGAAGDEEMRTAAELQPALGAAAESAPPPAPQARGAGLPSTAAEHVQQHDPDSVAPQTAPRSSNRPARSFVAALEFDSAGGVTRLEPHGASRLRPQDSVGGAQAPSARRSVDGCSSDSMPQVRLWHAHALRAAAVSSALCQEATACPVVQHDAQLFHLVAAC
jgi:hypothetical protein